LALICVFAPAFIAPSILHHGKASAADEKNGKLAEWEGEGEIGMEMEMGRGGEGRGCNDCKLV
jgi:hypothetical protein